VGGTELHKVQLEAFGQLADPLPPQACGRSHEDPVAGAAQDQLLHVQPGHDRLPRAGVIGEQVPKPRLT
jgi:hypothetical protein